MPLKGATVVIAPFRGGTNHQLLVVMIRLSAWSAPGSIRVDMALPLNALRKKSNCLSASIRGNAKDLSLAQHLLLCDARSLNAACAPSVPVAARSVP